MSRSRILGRNFKGTGIHSGFVLLSGLYLHFTHSSLKSNEKDRQFSVYMELTIYWG